MSTLEKSNWKVTIQTQCLHVIWHYHRTCILMNVSTPKLQINSPSIATSYAVLSMDVPIHSLRSN